MKSEIQSQNAIHGQALVLAVNAAHSFQHSNFGVLSALNLQPSAFSLQPLAFSLQP
jgi:hypothetical protein